MSVTRDFPWHASLSVSTKPTRLPPKYTRASPRIELTVQDVVSGDVAKASGKFKIALVSIASM
ncbi:hypothetical protein [Sphingobium chlorophenolicum]|uniref:Uncharacterized protein n=1 Tax=Sphingobium chlorophenolicum TaxID=46429 RepID=A0A081R842_SPHCR|nr:hypothetical protein [Sphingobium chlorophenolicum]KEQ51365.1 hypothetical protein BV95_04367 [Sphingobium chlorophenolicum]